MRWIVRTAGEERRRRTVVLPQAIPLLACTRPRAFPCCPAGRLVLGIVRLGVVLVCKRGGWVKQQSI